MKKEKKMVVYLKIKKNDLSLFVDLKMPNH